MIYTSVKGTSSRRPTASSADTLYDKPEDFIADIEDTQIREDVQALHKMIRRVAPALEPQTRFKGTLGYGKYNVQYKTGRQEEWCKLGISYGKQVTLHCSGFVNGKYILEEFSGRLPRATLGMTSLRFQKLGDLNLQILEEIIDATAKADGIVSEE
jgi:hypothetical protein